MKNNSSLSLVLIAIGTITTLVGCYAFIESKPFGTYFPALLFGIVLIGSGLKQRVIKA